MTQDLQGIEDQYCTKVGTWWLLGHVLTSLGHIYKLPLELLKKKALEIGERLHLLYNLTGIKTCHLICCVL
jgi:hypothetical protein